MLDDMLTVVDMDRKLQGTETQVGGFDLVWCGGPIRPVSSVALVVGFADNAPGLIALYGGRIVACATSVTI